MSEDEQQNPQGLDAMDDKQKENQTTTEDVVKDASGDGAATSPSGEASADTAAEPKSDGDSASASTEASSATAEPAAETPEPAAETAASAKAPDAKPKKQKKAKKTKPVPAHYQHISPAKLKRAKRTKRILVTIIVLLILLLAAAVVGVGYYYLEYGQVPEHHIETETVQITHDDQVNDRGTAETKEMPNLVAMFGRTPEEIVSTLGADYAITKTDTIESEGATEGAAPVLKQMVTIGYTPREESTSVGAARVQNIYLTLNEEGKTEELYFVSSMSILDFPISSFADLVGTKTSFVNTLASAGATVASNVAYTVPDVKEYTEYVDKEESILKIKKESVLFTGTLVSEQAPTLFEITYTYDYGASGVVENPDRQPLQRMLYIKLS